MTPSISKKAKYTFDNIIEAGKEHRLCLAACDDRKTGRKAYVLCETYVENGVTHFNPVARLFNGNPHNEVTPPGMSAHKLI